MSGLAAWLDWEWLLFTNGYNPFVNNNHSHKGSILCPKNRRKKQPPGMWKPPPQCHGHLPSTSTDWKFKPAFTTRPFPPVSSRTLSCKDAGNFNGALRAFPVFRRFFPRDLRFLIATPIVEITNKNNTEWWDEYQQTSNMYLSGQIIWYFTNMDLSEISLPKRYTFWRAQNSRLRSL